jgi:TonB dependent receptor/Carboxypeptidase regulatory-like domain
LTAALTDSNPHRKAITPVGDLAYDEGVRAMPDMGQKERRFQTRFGRLAGLLILAAVAIFIGKVSSQSPSTGAISTVITDPSGALVANALITLTNVGTGAVQSATSDELGRSDFPLLSPGAYRVSAKTPDGTLVGSASINAIVTERVVINLHLHLSTVQQHVMISSESATVQTESSALGRVVDETSVVGLPLVTRNFAQIAGLAPGVISGVNNAGELGLGGTALSQIAKSNDGIYVHGARSYDNNFQLDGISVNDVQGSASGSGGIPIPNPDSVQEFKVQTGLYDAGYGRYGGANVSVITRSGSNTLHATAFEFLRNEILNANDFFLNQAGQKRPTLKQNQFGVTAGGPIKPEKLLIFGSYQGARQVNGVAAGQSRTACTASLRGPPLTNDRSPAALGEIFGGLTGALGGVSVRPDGSNINPVALSLLNLKLSDGTFLIPTPQSLEPGRPLMQQGFSVASDPCHFNEDQFLANADFLARPNSRFSARFFLANADQTVTFPGNGLNPSGNIHGFTSPNDTYFRVVSLSHAHIFDDGWLNLARFGYVRTESNTQAKTPFGWSDIGVAEGEMSHNNDLPSLSILGSVSIASGFPRSINQNSLVLSDELGFVRGKHSLRLGGSITRLQDNVDLVGLGSFVQFLSWPDFLIGLSARANGTNFSNVFASFDDFGLTTREYTVWEGTGFVQDDYRIVKGLTLNVGVRYEHLGQFADALGRNASFDPLKADLNPPASGSVAGYVVAANFPGIAPEGVVRTHNNFGNDGAGQNTIAPRLGFAWQPLLHSPHLVLRGGYGVYYSRPTGQAFYQNILGAPFSQFRMNTGQSNASASFETPFLQPFPTPESFPTFPSYSPTSNTTIYSIAPGFRPALMQQYSLNVQTALHETWLLEVGYVGTRATHQMLQRSLNQALSASASNPIRGLTDNTLGNLLQRVPLLGVPPDSLVEMESEGSSWYNGLEASMEKHLSHGVQFLASYTFSKTLDTDGADINSTSSGNGLTLGNQDDPRQRWGRASFDRTHRFILSAVWMLPTPSGTVQRTLLGGWTLAAIATLQSGNALTIADTNSANLYGISEDRAQLSTACSKDQLVKDGSVESKLNYYFNVACFTDPPVIGADGAGTAFGNSATGIVNGPGQANLDTAFSKSIFLGRTREKNCSLDLRVEFYNLLNHPQFADPDNNFKSPSFGVINSTSVNSRVGQLALKFSF